MDDMIIRKQWFIKSRTSKVDDYYEVDTKKVKFYVSIYFFRFWAQALMDKLSKQSKKEAKLIEPSKLYPKIKSKTLKDLKEKLI